MYLLGMNRGTVFNLQLLKVQRINVKTLMSRFLTVNTKTTYDLFQTLLTRQVRDVGLHQSNKSTIMYKP